MAIAATNLQLERNGALLECTQQYAPKSFIKCLTGPALLEMAGFAVVFAFPLLERVSGLGLGLGLGLTAVSFSASDPVVTSLAGFAGGRRLPTAGGSQ